MNRPLKLTQQVRQLAHPPRMSPTLTRRVYLATPAAGPAASHLLVRQIALSAPAADRRAFLALGVLGELVEYLFGVDLLMIALL